MPNAADRKGLTILEDPHGQSAGEQDDNLSSPSEILPTLVKLFKNANTSEVAKEGSCQLEAGKRKGAEGEGGGGGGG